jgi:hypothetical protein
MRMKEHNNTYDKAVTQASKSTDVIRIRLGMLHCSHVLLYHCAWACTGSKD